jgi:hypothetical protein
MTACISSTWPSFVEVTFPRINLDNSPSSAVYVSTVTIKQAMASNAVGSPGGKTIHDTCPAYYLTSGSSSPQNLAQLRALAVEIAQDFYSYKQNAFDLVYNGIVNWGAEGLSDCLEFTYDPFDVQTRIISGPINSYPEEFMHYSYASTPSSSSTSRTPSSSSSCGYFDGKLTRLSDVQCVGGKLAVYKQVETYDCGLLAKVDPSEKDHEAGCCDCSGTSGSGG